MGKETPPDDQAMIRRMEDGLRRAMKTPHKPNADYVRKPKQTPTPEKSRSTAQAHKPK